MKTIFFKAPGRGHPTFSREGSPTFYRGGQIVNSYGNYRTCDFSVSRGDVQTPCPPSGSTHAVVEVSNIRTLEHTLTKQISCKIYTNNMNDPQMKYRLGTVRKIFYWRFLRSSIHQTERQLNEWENKVFFQPKATDNCKSRCELSRWIVSRIVSEKWKWTAVGSLYQQDNGRYREEV